MKEWKQMIIDKIEYPLMIKRKKNPLQSEKVIFFIWGFCNLYDA